MTSGDVPCVHQYCFQVMRTQKLPQPVLKAVLETTLLLR